MSSRQKSASSVRSTSTLAGTKGKKRPTTKTGGVKEKKPPKLEFPCNACEREGINVEATSYCADCHENVCADCVRQHQKYHAMKKHIIRDKPEKHEPKEVVKHPAYNPRECSLHKGKNVDMYCATHDELWCGSCVASKHKNCTNSMVIGDASRDIFGTSECQEITDDIRSIHEQLTTFRSISEDNLERMVKLKTDITAQIKEYRSKIDKAIEDLETATLQELENAYERGALQNDEDRKSYDHLLATLDQILNIMITASKDQGQEEAMFVAVKRAKEKIQEGQRMVGFNKHTETSKPFNFVEDRRILDWIKTFHTMGIFSYQCKSYSATLLGNYPINHKSDSKTSDVYGSAIMDDGRVLLADWDNKNLKVLDHFYKLQQVFPLPGNPCAVCCVNPDEAAISLTKQKVIQFVSTTGGMKLLHILRTGESCRGLDCRGGKLYVVCGGFKNEGNAKINIYTLSGELVRVIERNNLGQPIFLSPVSIAISANARTYHVADGERGIITMTYKNDVLSVFSGVDTAWPCGICIDRNDNALVCNATSRNVVQINGVNKLGTIITSMKGVNKPHSVAFDANNLRLILSASKSKVISVYQLEVKEHRRAKSDQEDIPPVTVTLTKPQTEPNTKTPRRNKGATPHKAKDESSKPLARSKTQVQLKDAKTPRSNAVAPKQNDGVDVNGDISKKTEAVQINDEVVNAISKMLLSGKPTKPADLKASLQKALDTTEKPKTDNKKTTEPVQEKQTDTEDIKGTPKKSNAAGVTKEANSKSEREKTMTSARKREIGSARGAKPSARSEPRSSLTANINITK